MLVAWGETASLMSKRDGKTFESHGRGDGIDSVLAGVR
jgi:hypothetical protein